jgi:hypothetical protein
MVVASRSLGSLLTLLVALAIAIGTAFAQDPPAEEPKSSPPPPPPAPTTMAATGTFVTGTANLKDGAAVPVKWLPPGAFQDDRGPSTAIYPPQKLTLRFNHKFHVGEQKLKCESCHKGALTSESVQDRLTPKGTTCDGCHGTEHGDLNKVAAGDDEMGKCNFCHLGYREGDGNRVAKLDIPRPNMNFNHKKHVARNINCAQCHGEVQELELATRDQLPRMRGCFGCHQHPDAPPRRWLWTRLSWMSESRAEHSAWSSSIGRWSHRKCRRCRSCR